MTGKSGHSYYLSVLCCIFAFLNGIGLQAQDSTPRNDLNRNTLKVLNSGINKRTFIPQPLQPAMASGAKNFDDSVRKAKEFISKTISSLDYGDNGRALVHIYDAINICPKEESRTYAIANSYYALALVKIGNNSRASTILNMCDSIFRKIGDFNLLAFHYNNLGLYYQKFYNQKLADGWFRKAIVINRTLGNEEGVAINLNNLAQGEGNEREKITFLREAIKINSKHNKIVALASNFNNMANQLYKLGEKNEALGYLSLSYSYLRTRNSLDILYSNLKLQSDIYVSQGKYKEAYQALLRMQKIEADSKKSTGDIEQMLQNRTISKKEYELKIKQKENDIKKLNYSLLSAGALIVVIIVISLSIYYYINNRRKLLLLQSRQKMTERDAEHAQAELVNIASYLSTRNEILDNIQCSLSKAQKMSDKDVFPELRKINLYIRNLQSKNTEVDSVLDKISKINREFIAKLTDMHPELTKNDKNIALLLRANLSTKQISALMECSPKSVNMARYRMRMHLNISSETNLVNYLKSL